MSPAVTESTVAFRIKRSGRVTEELSAPILHGSKGFLINNYYNYSANYIINFDRNKWQNTFFLESLNGSF